MKTIHLGRTGLTVSRLCLGTMNFGNQTPQPESFSILDHALATGVNFLDTANVYGGKRGEGVTENLLGAWFALGNRRDQVVIATKVYGNMGDGPNERGCSAYHIRAACEASLKRMRTDRIDLYQMHHIDRSTPWEEVWQAMDQLIAQGKVLYVGASNFAAWNIAEACMEAKARGCVGLVSEQSKYSLACRSIELEVLPACRRFGVGVIPWSPLDGGFLGGVLGGQGGMRRASEGMKKRVEGARAQLERWEGLCTRIGQRPADVALAWVLAQPGVTGPIIGPRTMAQYEDAVRAVDLVLDGPTLAEIDRIWPGPGNQAPEAYAW